MIPFRSDTFWRPLRRRLPAVFALLAYLTAALGMPLPNLAHKDRSQLFPCQNHACGCQSAEQCWRHCCCFTPEEHWAWARANHVEPPAYAEKPAPEKPTGWNAPRLRDQAEGKTTPSRGCARCAQTRNDQCEGEACAASGRQRIAGTDTSSPRPRDQRNADSQPASKGKWRLALGVNQLCCQGLRTLWLSSGTTLPPPPPTAWVSWQAPAGWLGSPDDLPITVSAPPPLPPPRLSCA